MRNEMHSNSSVGIINRSRGKCCRLARLASTEVVDMYINDGRDFIGSTVGAGSDPFAIYRKADKEGLCYARVLQVATGTDQKAFKVKSARSKAYKEGKARDETTHGPSVFALHSIRETS